MEILGCEEHLLFLCIDGILVTQFIYEKIQLMKNPYTTSVVCHPKNIFVPYLVSSMDIN